MVFAIADRTGELLGVYRMLDATVFSIDVSIAKARNTAYHADPVDVRDEDLGDIIEGLERGAALINHTFRFQALPRFPSGSESSSTRGTSPGPFSILNDPGVNSGTAENIGVPGPADEYMKPESSVYGYD
ncbi:MAG: hypothetical protein ACI9G1_000834 [Pirellulaceae bacterium]|jgi:hypothetical protein